MSETQAFPTEAVLSTITGVLISGPGLGCVYEVLNFMTGESLFTHQIPRISREARPVLVALHPELASACEEAEQVTPENWRRWRDAWIARYGATITVPKFNADSHEHIDPLSELAEKVHPDKIMLVRP